MPTRQRPTDRQGSTGTQNRRRKPTDRRTGTGRGAPDVVYTPPKIFQRKRFFLHLLTVLAVVLALILGMSIFFKVEDVYVSGAEKYSAWDVRQVSGIQDGENLLTLSRAKVAGRVTTQLPYVKEAKVTIKLPGTVNIQILESDVTYAVEAADNTWYLMDVSGKVVDKITGTSAKAYPRIIGVQIAVPEIGMQAAAAEPVQEGTEGTVSTEQTDAAMPIVTVTEAERFSWVLTILKNLEDSGFVGDISSIDVTHISGLELWYGQRYQIQLGDSTQLEYKIRMAKGAIDQLGEFQSGILDVSFTTWPDEVGYSAFSS